MQLLAVLVVTPVGVRGQLAITPGCEFPANWTPDSLVRNMLLGTGVRVSNVRLNGSSGIINNGCDSLVLYSLYVTYATYDSVQICKGEVYELEGQQFSEKGDYVIVYVTEQGCDSSHYLHLDVARKPEARMHVEPDRADVECREIKVYDQSKWETSRSWYLDGEYMGNESTMVFTYPIEKDSVKLTLVSFTGYECRDTAEVVVYYDRCALWVPNVFAPELEGNDRFRVASACIEEMEMWIYNREGMQVFHTTNVEEPWDGTNQRTGEKCPGGSYVYTINYLMTNHPITKKSKTGMVMLMR